VTKTPETDDKTEPTAPVEIPLHARINGARAWKPRKDRKTDAMLTGHVVAVVPRTSEYGTYPVVVVDTGHEAFSAFHAFHTVALEQLKTLKPSPGERITVVAHPVVDANKRKDANGDAVRYTPYSIFNPDAVQAVPDFDWGSVGGEGPAF
jgi:hypothetical protein